MLESLSLWYSECKCSLQWWNLEESHLIDRIIHEWNILSRISAYLRSVQFQLYCKYWRKVFLSMHIRSWNRTCIWFTVELNSMSTYTDIQCNGKSFWHLHLLKVYSFEPHFNDIDKLHSAWAISPSPHLNNILFYVTFWRKLLPNSSVFVYVVITSMLYFNHFPWCTVLQNQCWLKCCFPQIVTMLLDLSERFGVIDQAILLDWIKNRYATAWFKFYVMDHSQLLSLNGDSSEPKITMWCPTRLSYRHIIILLLYKFYLHCHTLQ